MGASEFYETAVDVSAKRAFSELVDNAKYEDGHGGYTGTIAEKHSFKIVRTASSLEEGQKIAEQLMDADHPCCDKWGPAACIDCGPAPGNATGAHVWLFFGLASS